MSIESVETLLSVLLRAEILTPEQAEEIARELRPLYADPVDLGEYLVQIDWLTAYQFRLLFTGHWDELTVGPYQVLDRLGEGGVSEVFKAWDTHRGRVVALKVLRRHLREASAAQHQFQCELQAVTRLSHPNIIKTYDANAVDNLHYFAMEFVEGMDLHKFVQQAGPLPVEQACDYARQIAQGLQHAHQVGLIHRDIKPANLFLLHPPLPAHPSPACPGGRRGPDPVVKILDWGLARCLRDPAVTPNGHPVAAEANCEAEKGILIGTADFIAPEQARDATLVDTRADIYSLGCTLYYLLTGQVPFPGGSLLQKLLQHQESEPPSVRLPRPEVPEELDAVLQKMMAKHPEDRYQIPLLVVAPLRRFCPGATGVTGSVIRPASGINLNGSRPGSSSSLARPASSSNLSRPATNGDGKPPQGRS